MISHRHHHKHIATLYFYVLWMLKYRLPITRPKKSSWATNYIIIAIIIINIIITIIINIIIIIIQSNAQVGRLARLYRLSELSSAVRR